MAVYGAELTLVSSGAMEEARDLAQASHGLKKGGEGAGESRRGKTKRCWKMRHSCGGLGCFGIGFPACCRDSFVLWQASWFGNHNFSIFQAATGF